MPPLSVSSRRLLAFLVSLGTVFSADANTVCDLSGGSMDEAGNCKLCLDPDNCNCVIDLETFAIACPDYCIDALSSGNEKQTHCGIASCASSMTGSLCTSEVLVWGSTLELLWTCSAARECSCRSASWGGQDCLSCEYLYGVGESFDCSNIGGPIGEPKTTAPAEQDSGPEQLQRTYRSDEAFILEMQELSLPEASDLAGVPIGGAVPDSLQGLEEHIPSDFNMVVAENSMKWNNLLSDPSNITSYNFTAADAMVAYATASGATVRGHVLIWGRAKGTTYPVALAQEVEDSPDPEGTLKARMQGHIEALAAHYRDRVGVWDVVNEHLTSRIDDNIFYATLGDDYVKLSFQLAREALPDSVRLVWNEALGSFSLDDPQISLWLSMLEQYKQEGVPIDGIGVQGHNINSLHNVTQVAAFLQRVSSLGYEIEITELDAPIHLFLDSESPFEAQGDFFASYAAACLDTGMCRGITFWGITDNSTWFDWVFPDKRPNLPLLIDEKGFHKPAWLSVRQALESFAVKDVTETMDQPAQDTTTADKSAAVHGACWSASAFAGSLRVELVVGLFGMSLMHILQLL